MFELLQNYFSTFSGPEIFLWLLVMAALMLAGLALPLGALYLVYFLLTLPLRRQERARCFLDLLELGLKDGRTAEAAIVCAADSHDGALGNRFQALAVRLDRGERLDAALGQVPRLLPPQVSAMLQAGCKIGDVSQVLPACRLLLRDGVSQVRGALNYLLLAGVFLAPVAIIVPLILSIRVLPAFRSMFSVISESAPLPPFTQFVFGSHWIFTSLQVIFFGLLWLAVLTYIGGPRLHCWADRFLPGAVDRLLYRLPWRRKRLQRDFSSMLAVLLDAGVAEPQAILLAGQSTANAVMVQRAAAAEAKLRLGAPISEAVQLMDDSAELRWRLSNALRQAKGFVRTLAGWQEALDAKAFQQEQAAAQLATTGLVLANGAMIGGVILAIFIALISIINEVALW